MTWMGCRVRRRDSAALLTLLGRRSPTRAFLVGGVVENLVVSDAGVTAEDSARPEMPGEHRVQFSAVQADLGQYQQKSDKSDHDPELAVRR
jgi:hypothetical protein